MKPMSRITPRPNMSLQKPLHLTLFFLLNALIFFSAAPLPSALATPTYSYEGKLPDIDDVKEMTFTQQDTLLCKNIARALERYHYTDLKFDDRLSSKILDRYLDILDPSRSLFTQSEINTFDKLRYWLDNTLKKGNLTPGYAIFNSYLKRSFQRLTHIITALETWETDFDFNQNETILLDRKDAPWPKDERELKALWDKGLENSILVMLMDGEKRDEITNILTKQYKSRLNRLLQTDAADTFKTYINAAAMSFDPHTQFFPPRMSEDFDIQMSLSLEGIGAVLQSEYEFTKVVSLIPAGPADKSGLLMPGDKIIGVGQGTQGLVEDTVGWRIDEVVKLIRGPKNTLVRLKIIPAAQKGSQNARVITIQRDKVKLEEQAASKTIVPMERDSQKLTVGVITIPTFYLDFKGMQEGADDYRSTTRDVMQLLNELKKEKIDGLIIDLRDNGGGSLQEVNLLTGLFIKSGPTVQIRSRNGYISRLEDPDPAIEYNGPLMVMINRMSASASEIFAGAIKDYHRGIIVGTPTFGKGTVQALQPIDNGQLKLTTAKFYRVSGESTQNLGVLPDIKFPAIYNADEAGESSLEGALPWDRTIKAQYQPYDSLIPAIATLQEAHLKRVENQPDFTYLKERYDLAQRLYEIKQLPLNREKREAHKKTMNQLELDLENRFRVAKGLAPYASYEALHPSPNANIENDEAGINKIVPTDKSGEMPTAEKDAAIDGNEKSASPNNVQDRQTDATKHENLGTGKDQEVQIKGNDEEKDDILLKEAQEMMADFIILAGEKHYRW